MAGQLPLEQLVVVRIHCPQLNSLILREFFIGAVQHTLASAGPFAPAIVALQEAVLIQENGKQAYCQVCRVRVIL
jgi:hypothetical protein